MDNTNLPSVNSKDSLPQKEELFTTKQLAEQLTVDVRTITRAGKKCFPQKEIIARKTTYWTKSEITVLLDFMQKNNNRTDLASTTVVEATSTELTPALKIKQAMEMMQEAYEEEIARINAEKLMLVEYKNNTEKKLANGELIETPSENVRNHLWQNIQQVGTAMNDYRKAWHEFWKLVKRDTSIDVKTRAFNKDMKPLDYICNELDIEVFNKIFALSEKMKNEYCGE